MSVLQFRKANCKNCYKCVRNCPVKAIEVKNHQAQVIERDCVLCGNCITVCPQNAKEVRCDTSIVKNLIREGRTVIASVAPSYIATYQVASFAVFAKALKELGFADVQETAQGAYLVKREYEALLEENASKPLISSCCPTVIKLMQKYYPNTLPYLAPVLSPMQAHAKLIKQKNPQAVVVFIGPCISKKDECAQDTSLTEIALTFEELDGWLEEREISLEEGLISEESTMRSRFFPISGGILNTMDQREDVHYVAIDGLENCIAALKEIQEGKLDHCFIEMSACEGGCVGGHAFSRRPARIAAKARVQAVADGRQQLNDYDIETSLDLERQVKPQHLFVANPSEKEIAEILKKMGKNKLEDELNCGTCGYSTCREKAIAVYFGKAEISMCLPFMKERAESFSDKIISITPNAILTVDTDLKIQQINLAGCRLFSLSKAEEVIGNPISRLMDEFDFAELIATGEHKRTKRAYLAEYNKYVEQTFLYDEGNAIVICIMKDVTETAQKREQISDKKNQAAQLTDKIVEKQLRIVHEIASLLGETAAETKVALTELKDIILMEEEEP